MQMTDGERLIVVMLAEVMEAMGLNGEIDPSMVKRLAINRDDWAIKTQYHGFLHDEGGPTEAEVAETHDILAMWSFIEYSIGELVGEEAKEAAGFRHTRFSGFDGNNDPHHGIAHTLINDLGRWTEFKDHPLNSHSMASIARYRAMLPKFETAMQTYGSNALPIDGLRKLLT